MTNLYHIPIYGAATSLNPIYLTSAWNLDTKCSPSVRRALPPVGVHSTAEQLLHTTTVWEWLNTVVLRIKHNTRFSELQIQNPDRCTEVSKSSIAGTSTEALQYTHSGDSNTHMELTFGSSPGT